jgi:hypothetical protein
LSKLENVGQLTQVGSGYLMIVDRCDRTQEIRRYAADGTVTNVSGVLPSWTVHFARSADGQVAASLKPGRLTLFDPSGRKSQTWALPAKVTFIQPLAVFPDGSVTVLGDSATGNRYYLLQADGSITRPGRMLRGTPAVSPVNGDVLQSGNRTSCDHHEMTALVDPQTGRTVWADCGYSPRWTSFSSDGTTVAVIAHHGLGLIDARTGALLVAFQGGCLEECATGFLWEDSAHLLVQSRGATGRYRVIRYGTDGSAQKVPLDTSLTGFAAPLWQALIMPWPR